MNCFKKYTSFIAVTVLCALSLLHAGNGEIIKEDARKLLKDIGDAAADAAVSVQKAAEDLTKEIAAFYRYVAHTYTKRDLRYRNRKQRSYAY